MNARVLGSSTAITLLTEPCAKQLAGQDLDALRGRALAHADHHRTVADDQDVAALAGGRLVRARVVAVVEAERRRRSREHRVEVVDQPRVDRLPLAGGLDIGLTDSPSYTQAELSRWNRWLGSGRQHEVVGRRGTPAAGWTGAASCRSCLRTPPIRAVGQPCGRGLGHELVAAACPAPGRSGSPWSARSWTNSRAPGWSRACGQQLGRSRCTTTPLRAQLRRRRRRAPPGPARPT